MAVDLFMLGWECDVGDSVATKLNTVREKKSSQVYRARRSWILQRIARTQTAICNSAHTISTTRLSRKQNWFSDGPFLGSVRISSGTRRRLREDGSSGSFAFPHFHRISGRLRPEEKIP
jgi:hypothetical protein